MQPQINLYNFDVSVALTDIQSDEIDSEFAEAIHKLMARGIFLVVSARKCSSLKGA